LQRFGLEKKPDFKCEDEGACHHHTSDHNTGKTQQQPETYLSGEPRNITRISSVKRLQLPPVFFMKVVHFLQFCSVILAKMFRVSLVIKLSTPWNISLASMPSRRAA